MPRLVLRHIAMVAVLTTAVAAWIASTYLGEVALLIPSTVASATSTDGARLDEDYRYGQAAFARLLGDSYEEVGATNLQAFPQWLETAYAASSVNLRGFEHERLEQALTHRASQVRQSRDGARRAALEIETGVWLHRAVKTLVPRFSLDRGFEFANVVKFGERQCLLQSTLIAALLQAVDIRAGVYMVWTSAKGEVSNNGHAVTVIKLSDGRDLLVDASEATPVIRHQGLFVRKGATGQYRFVEPVYDTASAIVAYRPTAGGPPMTPAEARPLDRQFVRSQFYFYRGERAPGGFLGQPRTAAGLAASARFLERAARENPRNPLAVYVLGHVYLKQDNTAAAKTQYKKGYALYTEFGYVPRGPKAAYASTLR